MIWLIDGSASGRISDALENAGCRTIKIVTARLATFILLGRTLLVTAPYPRDVD